MYRSLKMIPPVIAILVAGARSAAQSDSPTPGVSNISAPVVASISKPKLSPAMPGAASAVAPNMMVAQTGPNTYRASLSSKTDHYMDATGTWQPVAPRFSQIGAGQNAQYSGDGSLVQTHLPVIHAAGPTVVRGTVYHQEILTTTFRKVDSADQNHIVTSMIKIGSRPVTVTGEVQWTPTRMVVGGATAIRADLNAASTAVGSPNGSDITYPNAYGAIAERMTMLADGMKDDLVIPSAAALRQVAASTDGMIGFESAFTLTPGLAFYVNGVRQTSDFIATGAIEVRDENGRPLFLLPPVTASDSGVVTATVYGQYGGHFSGESIFLTANIPIQWLFAPERQWPVSIDPTVFIYPTTADQFIYAPNPNGNYGASNNVLVGDQFNSLVRWDISSLPANAMINLSNAWLYHFASYGYLTDTVNAYPVMSLWDESAVTWNSRQISVPWTIPGGDKGNLLDGEIVDSAVGWNFFIVTDAAAQWYNGQLGNNGLLFSAPINATNAGFFKNFYSREQSTSPQLYVDYTLGSINLSPYAVTSRGVPSPDHYAVTRGPKWDAIAIRPPANTDYDMFLASTNAYSDALVGSGAGVGAIDYVLINGNYSPADNFYPAVSQFSGTGAYRIEQATNTEDMNGYKTYGPYTMPVNDVVRIWNAFLPSGITSYFRVRPVSGDANLSMALHWTNPADLTTVFQGRGQEVASSNGGGAGKPAYMSFTPSATDNYGLVVLNNGATADTSYYVDVSTTPFPRAYVPSAMNNYSPACDQFDPDETEGQRKGPLLAGVNYQARLCQNDVDRFYFDVNSTGIVQISITVPSSLLINASSGASISIYHVAPDNTTLINCDTPFVDKSAYYVPLTQVTTVFRCPITGTGQYRANVYTTDPATIYDNVNYYTLRLDYPTPPCDQFDPDENYALSLNNPPLLSGVTYRSRLCQNDFDHYYFDIPTAGNLQISITVPSTLLVDANNGAAITAYNPYPSAQWLLGCNTAELNGGGYFSPLTQLTTVFTCPISTAGRYRLVVKASNSATIYDNINSYSFRVTYP